MVAGLLKTGFKTKRMILNRLGNKKRIAKDVIKYFPAHDMFIDMFFGAGGIFFNKPMAKYNICNDLDDDVFNLYRVVREQKTELVAAFELMPISESLMKYWRSHLETDPIKKAVRFLMLSNFGYMGKPGTLLLGKKNSKQIILNRVDQTFERIKFCQFICGDFRNVLGKIEFKDRTYNDRTFIYADPPYLNTTNNYKQGFTEKDTIDLFELLIKSGIKFAISEFDNEFVTGLANDYNLNIIIIGDRLNMKNRRTEILVTNYKNPLSLFD